MTKRTARTPEQLPLPSLIVPRNAAKQKIDEQIQKGRELNNLTINSQKELEASRAERSKWSSYNTELLKRIFDNTSIADEYDRFYGGAILMDPSLADLVKDFHHDMSDSISRLESIQNRLDLIPEIIADSAPYAGSKPTTGRLGQDVFIVHGHDEAAKEATSRLIERLKLKAIILHEQPNASRTVIEKFEAYSNVGFAIVLLTPDDIGLAPISWTPL